ncbi:MAG: alpha/beta fold hydrolase [Myxococcaceae bacterium]
MAALGVVAPPLAARLARTLYFRPNRLSARQAERDVLTRGTRFVVEDDGVQVVGRSWGRGPVIVLVHGWSGHLGQLTPFVDPLVERGFQVVGFDWPGHGDSHGDVSSLLHAARVLKAMQELFGPFHAVIAHSFGAAATVYATSTGLQVGRLALHAPVARLDRYIDAYSSALGLSAQRRADFISSCEAWLEQPFSSFEPLEAARKVKVPTLVLHSADDREVAIEDGAQLATALEGTLLTKEGLGHRKLLRDPSCVAETVVFLSEGTAQAPRPESAPAT